MHLNSPTAHARPGGEAAAHPVNLKSHLRTGCEAARPLNLKSLISDFRFRKLHKARGFTLIELMVVIFLLLVLATMAVPLFQSAIVHAREAVLKQDLYTLRKLVDEFTLDKQRAPTSLDELVDAGYLKAIPVDPFTGSNDTWRTDIEDVPLNPTQAAAGIVDVHSGADGTALDGTQYSSW
jgi:general secretion pathway protein G